MMFFLATLAMAGMPAVNTVRMSDCKPMLSLAANEQPGNVSTREATQRKGEPRKIPPKPCVTLASA